MSETEQSVRLEPCWCRSKTDSLSVRANMDHGDFACRERGRYVFCSNCWAHGPTYNSEAEAIKGWNRSRASVVAPQGDVLHWQLKAGVAETMCGVAIEAEEGIRVSLLSDMATCKACDAAAWGYKCGRADAASSPVAPSPTTCGPARPDDGSECLYSVCPRPRDGCSEYCWQHHASQCSPTPEQEQSETVLMVSEPSQIECAVCGRRFPVSETTIVKNASGRPERVCYECSKGKPRVEPEWPDRLTIIRYDDGGFSATQAAPPDRSNVARIYYRDVPPPSTQPSVRVAAEEISRAGYHDHGGRFHMPSSTAIEAIILKHCFPSARPVEEQKCPVCQLALYENPAHFDPSLGTSGLYRWCAVATAERAYPAATSTTPDGEQDVTRGLQEMELLADYISADVDDAIKALATPVTAPVSTGERSVDDDPLTDAEVDAWLKAHKDEPVDPARASRIEWLFRKKLAASIIDKAKEWLRSYDERIAAGGKGAQNMERLYGEEAAFHREVIRALETLAL